MSVAALQNRIEGDVSNIIQRLESLAVNEQVIADARKNYPQYRFVLCSEDDMYEQEPYQTCNHFDVHLIKAGMGCSSLTRDIDDCAGLVIALHEEYDGY